MAEEKNTERNLQMEMQQLNDRIKDMESAHAGDLAAIQAEIAATRDQLVADQTAFEKNKKALIDTQTKLETLENQKATTEQELAAVQAEKAKLEAAIKQRQKAQENTAAEIEVAKIKLKGLEEDLERKKNEKMADKEGRKNM